MGFDNDHLGTLMPFGAPSTPSFREGVANGVKSDPKGLCCSETIKVALTTARPRSTEMFCDLAR